ncbi:hypothetical protein R1sor_012109 [Riccia sorocarpa]|uniref:F-box domain-containing protein n=1 Tax=Riccia sorocarpa TaxID=122646 RepID=A0ABD3I370_9MARC
MLTVTKKKVQSVEVEAPEVCQINVDLAGEFWSELPKEIIEKIVSMIPYPYILNVRNLGKDWKSKFDETSFREMVKSTSIDWPIYFPLFLEKSKRVLTGLDRRNGTWIKICLEPAVDLKHPSVSNRESWELAGCNTGTRIHPKNHIFVYNVITRVSKLLPQRVLRPCDYTFPGPVISASYKPIYMLPDGPENYKVLYIVQVAGEPEDQVCTNLYESRSNSWTAKLSSLRPWDSAETAVIIDTSSGVYLNGVVYLTSRRRRKNLQKLLEVWAYDVETGGWHLVLGPREFGSARLMVCENQLLLFHHLNHSSARLRNPELCKNSFILYKIDALTRDCREIYRGPQESIPDASSSLYLSHGGSIFFGDFQKPTKYMMEFDVRNRKWSRFPSPSVSYENLFQCLSFSSFAFQPGQNPFIVV